MSGGNVQPSIDAAEHIGGNTGDNIEAKRVGLYGFTGTQWSRIPVPLLDTAYDYISITYPDTQTEIYTFKTGGSGGTTVRTLTLTYTDSTKDSLSTVARS